MTPNEFKNAVEGWEEEKRERMNLDRIFTASLVQIHVKPGKIVKPTDIVRFHWDEIGEKAKGKLIEDPAEIEAMKARIRERKLKNKR